MTKRRDDDIALASSTELGSRVADWLRGEGYPLEMTVARGLRDVGFTVTQSDQYQDPETDKLREIDVVGRWMRMLAIPGGADEMLAELSIVVECKRSDSRPWVLFTNPARSAPRRATGLQVRQRRGSSHGFLRRGTGRCSIPVRDRLPMG
jgi:hypothetical protein